MGLGGGTGVGIGTGSGPEKHIYKPPIKAKNIDELLKELNMGTIISKPLFYTIISSYMQQGMMYYQNGVLYRLHKN